jgi:hypothetical protein
VSDKAAEVEQSLSDDPYIQHLRLMRMKAEVLIQGWLPAID